MSRVAHIGANVHQNKFIYIEDQAFADGSIGYLIDFSKTDDSRFDSDQCKIKLIEKRVYLKSPKGIRSKREYISQIEKESIKYFSKYLKIKNRRFVDFALLEHNKFYIFVCYKILSDWEFNLLPPSKVKEILLFN